MKYKNTMIHPTPTNILLPEPLPWPSTYRAPEVVTFGATELSRMIHAREVSCTEVMHGYLKHISTLNPIVNAIISLCDYEDLISEADQCDQELEKATPGAGYTEYPKPLKIYLQ